MFKLKLKTTRLLLILFVTNFYFVSQAYAEKKIERGVSDELEDLETYSDVVVIQKKFFEKSSKWEFAIAGIGSLNNKFFTSYGAKANLGYHLSERWSIEGQAWYLAQTARDIKDNLFDRYSIETKDIATPQGFLGLSLVWSPIYGKLSLLEKSINPFELFFTLGLGAIITDDDQTVPAMTFSFGQIHPVSKTTTLRWEIGGNVFQAKGKEDLVGSQRGKEGLFEIFFVSVGASFFFPESK